MYTPSQYILTFLCSAHMTHYAAGHVLLQYSDIVFLALLAFLLAYFRCWSSFCCPVIFVVSFCLIITCTRARDSVRKSIEAVFGILPSLIVTVRRWTVRDLYSRDVRGSTCCIEGLPFHQLHLTHQELIIDTPKIRS